MCLNLVNGFMRACIVYVDTYVLTPRVWHVQLFLSLSRFNARVYLKLPKSHFGYQLKMFTGFLSMEGRVKFVNKTETS